MYDRILWRSSDANNEVLFRALHLLCRQLLSRWKHGIVWGAVPRGILLCRWFGAADAVRRAGLLLP